MARIWAGAFLDTLISTQPHWSAAPTPPQAGGVPLIRASCNIQARATRCISAGGATVPATVSRRNYERMKWVAVRHHTWRAGVRRGGFFTRETTIVSAQRTVKMTTGDHNRYRPQQVGTSTARKEASDDNWNEQ